MPPVYAIASRLSLYYARVSKKRGHGEGTIFEEKHGRWVACITTGYEFKEGKRRRIRKKFVAESRAMVAKKLNAALRDQDQGVPIPVEGETFRRSAEKWLADVKARVRPSTYASYKWQLDHHVLPLLGDLRLFRITPEDIEAALRAKIESGLSPRTAQLTHAMIRMVLKRAQRHGQIGRNVALLVSPPRQEKKETEPLTPAQAQLLLNVVAGDRLEAVYSVALAVGLRRGEVLGLSWEDVNLDAGLLTVRRTVQRVGGDLVLSEPKTQDSRRTVPLPGFTITALRKHQERQRIARIEAGDNWIECGLVFTTTIGTPIEPRNLVRHFHAALETAKLPRHRFHDLRHTSASLLLAQGATLHEVKEILGHSQIHLTANLYGHAYIPALRKAVSRMDAVLAPAKSLAPQLAPLRKQ